MLSIRSLAAVLVVLTASCNTPGHIRAVKTASKLDELALSIEELRSAASETSASLAALVAAKDQDPAPTFHRFEGAVQAFESARRRVDARVHGVRAEADAYFLAWREQAAAIGDADLKESSEERRTELGEAVDHVEESMKPARETLDEHSKSLGDTLTYLSIDLTPKGISSIEGRAKSATKTVKSLDEELVDVLEAVKKATPQFAAVRPTVAPRKVAPKSGDEERNPGS